MRYQKFILPILVLSFVSCSLSDSSDSNDLVIETEEYTIVNDEDLLNTRLKNYDTDLEILIDTTKGDQINTKSAPPRFRLYLKSESAPPTILGNTVQATMVETDGSSRTVISYNQRGEDYIGAIEIAQITGNGRIRLKSSIQFEDTDVNAISVSSRRINAAISTSDQSIISDGTGSAMQSFSYNSFTFNEDTTYSADLPSFAANSVKFYNNLVYVTTGNTGGLSVYNEDFSTMLGFVDIPEARWVDVNDDYIVVLAGDSDGDNNGTIYLINASDYSVANQYPFPGAYTPEAKNTVQLVNHLAFIAAGQEGVQIMDLTTGNIVEQIEKPDASSLGLSDDVVTTNAVAVDEDVIFISNGEAGVYVAEGSRDFSTLSPGSSFSVTLLGQVQFDDLQSANHVAFKNKIFSVASGLGGIKSIELRR